jgi:hypothetical protein
MDSVILYHPPLQTVLLVRRSDSRSRLQIKVKTGWIRLQTMAMSCLRLWTSFLTRGQWLREQHLRRLILRLW